MKLENTRNFRSEAEKKNLIIKSNTKKRKFYFNLKDGTFFTPANPKKVFQLVKLARKYAESDRYGEHNALLQRMAKRNELNNETVLWEKNYFEPEVAKNRWAWVSLQDWLVKEGYDPLAI